MMSQEAGRWGLSTEWILIRQCAQAFQRMNEVATIMYLHERRDRPLFVFTLYSFLRDSDLEMNNVSQDHDVFMTYNSFP